MYRIYSYKIFIRFRNSVFRLSKMSKIAKMSIFRCSQMSNFCVFESSKYVTTVLRSSIYHSNIIAYVIFRAFGQSLKCPKNIEKCPKIAKMPKMSIFDEKSEFMKFPKCRFSMSKL